MQYRNTLYLIDRPLCNYFKTYTISVDDPLHMFTDKTSIITEQINDDITEYKGIKFSIGFLIEFYHDELNGKRREVHGQKHDDPIVFLFFFFK